jgi:IS1 family transposase
VAYAVGDRSEATCRCLWEAIPLPYRTGHCFTDFWIAYQAVIPEGQHTAEGCGNGRNRSRRTLEHYTSAALGSFCSQNSFML